MKHTFKDAKIFFDGVEFAEVAEGSYSFDSDEAEPAPDLGPRSGDCKITLGPFVLDASEVEFFKWLGFRLFPSITPDGIVGRACLGVIAWRMLDELRAPLHRRTALAPFWAKALQPSYIVSPPGMKPVRVPGNVAGVLAAFARVRKAAGEFDGDDLERN